MWFVYVHKSNFIDFLSLSLTHLTQSQCVLFALMEIPWFKIEYIIVLYAEKLIIKKYVSFALQHSSQKVKIVWMIRRSTSCTHNTHRRHCTLS